MNASGRMIRRRGSRWTLWLLGMVYAGGMSVLPVWGEPILYEGTRTWAAISGLSEMDESPLPDWELESGIWVGRIPPETTELIWGDEILKTDSAFPMPPPSIHLPVQRNPFGPCLVRSLSIRYNSLVHSRKWSLVFNEEGEEPDFIPIPMPVGPKSRMVLEMEDVVSGKRWMLRPTRRGREGGIFSRGSDARLYAGTVDAGDLEWNLLVVPGEEGRMVLQGRVMVMESLSRLVRFRVLFRSDAPGIPLLQEESPPAVVAATNGVAVALFVDLAEPRRFRAVRDSPGLMGLEFDLAVTKATGNFPRTATFSLELDSWKTTGPETAASEAVARLTRAGGSIALPESVVREGVEAQAVFEPSRMWLSPPGGGRGRADVLAYLLLKTSGLFPDSDWAASAFLCAAQNAKGKTRVDRVGEQSLVPVNADPDFKAMLELGQNRGQTVLARIRQGGAAAVWIRAAAQSHGLDYNPRALHLCDYPAVWAGDSLLPGLDLRHAESELIASLACVLKKEAVCLLVSDAGPMAPFTTYHADALICESDDPSEMRRQRALAGSRPVVWAAEGADTTTEAVAQDLGFVRIGKNEEK